MVNIVINNYYIEYEDDNVVLIVNLDFNYEFGDFKNIVGNIKDEINNLGKIISANKIKILVNGLLISTLYLTPAILNNDDISTYKLITNDTLYSFNKIDIEPPTLNNEISVLENKLPIKNKIDSNENKPNVVIKPSNISSSIKKDNSIIKDDNNSTKNENKDTNMIKDDNNIYVSIHRGDNSIVELELEQYLIGVVGSEMPASFNIEALKAQAIVARTYALKRISENKILTDNTSTQVYKDNNELKQIWKNDFDKYYKKIENAVLSTKGIVIKYNNKYIDAVYHSTSNGYTEDAINVWGYSIPYLKQVESKYDVNVSSYKREKVFTFVEISNLIDTIIGENTEFILERNESNRVKIVKINDIEIDGITFRNLLGLRSTDFTIEIKNENVIITTYGYGHGVGMSQYGANSMANSEYNYKDILNHYYKNVTIEKE